MAAAPARQTGSAAPARPRTRGRVGDTEQRGAQHTGPTQPAGQTGSAVAPDPRPGPGAGPLRGASESETEPCGRGAGACEGESFLSPARVRQRARLPSRVRGNVRAVPVLSRTMLARTRKVTRQPYSSSHPGALGGALRGHGSGCCDAADFRSPAPTAGLRATCGDSAPGSRAGSSLRPRRP